MLYELIRRDRVGKDGGRLLIYVKLNYKPSNVIIDEVSEMVSLVLTSDKQKIGIVACYRPPYEIMKISFSDHLIANFKILN